MLSYIASRFPKSRFGSYYLRIHKNHDHVERVLTKGMHFAVPCGFIGGTLGAFESHDSLEGALLGSVAGASVGLLYPITFWMAACVATGQGIKYAYQKFPYEIKHRKSSR